MIDIIADFINSGLAGEGLALALGGADEPSASKVASAIKPFVAAIPGALSFLFRASKDVQVGRAVEFATGQALTYLFDEHDLLPEAEFGVAGLIDDALLLHTVTAEFLTWYPHLDEFRFDYAVPDLNLFELVRAVLPDGTSHALEKSARSLVGVSSALLAQRPVGSLVQSSTSVQFRVTEAAAILSQ